SPGARLARGGSALGAATVSGARPSSEPRARGAGRPVLGRDPRRRRPGAPRVRLDDLPPERTLAPRGPRALPRPPPEQDARLPRARVEPPYGALAPRPRPRDRRVRARAPRPHEADPRPLRRRAPRPLRAPRARARRGLAREGAPARRSRPGRRPRDRHPRAR